MDSIPSLTFRESDAAKEDFCHCLCTTGVVLHPGRNVVQVQTKVSRLSVIVMLLLKRKPFKCDGVKEAL